MNEDLQRAFMALVAAYIWWQILASSDKERERQQVVDLYFGFISLLGPSKNTGAQP